MIKYFPNLLSIGLVVTSGVGTTLIPISYHDSCMTDEQNLSTNTLTENQQTQDSDSFFNNLDTILFHYTEQMQMQSQSKSSPIIIQDDTPLVSMGPSNNLQSSVIIGI